VEAAFFEARLNKISVDEEPWLTRLLFFYPCRNYRHPTLVVDVTEVHALKRKAMYAHRSQVGSRSFRTAGTNDVFASVEIRDRFYGSLIGRPFGEGLVATGPLPVTGTDQLFFRGCP
jgi:LmbE family N-acetylglucosaminyl deacetylase